MKIDITIINEEGKKYHGTLNLTEKKEGSKEKKIETIEEKIPQKIMDKIIEKLESIKIYELALVILHFHKKLTKSQQIEILTQIGKNGKSLKGGNYNRDIIKKGWVKEIGTSGRDKIFTLTEKGKRDAQKILETL